jgi:hypothetical protein
LRVTERFRSTVPFNVERAVVDVEPFGRSLGDRIEHDVTIGGWGNRNVGGAGRVAPD